jgi:hydrogenase/urease accessory protein HupE
MSSPTPPLWVRVLPMAGLLLVLFGAADAHGHPLAPIALSIEEHGEDVTVTVKRSRVQPRGANLAPRFPSSCEAVAPVTFTSNESSAIERHSLRCGASLVGTRFGVDGLTEANLDAVVSVTLSDGRVVRGLLDDSDDVYVVPQSTTVAEVASTFARSGLLHLLGGFDHLLFVVGIVLLLRRPRRVLVALTAFTLGHGLSMCAATLGWIDLPSRVAESAIAVTLVWLAWEIVRQNRDVRNTRGVPNARGARTAPELKRPYLAAVGVGLVHGLGFAAAFSAAGVGGSDLSVALIAFHTGIELGQVAVVVVALAAMKALASQRNLVERVAGYAIGSLAFMWLAERVLLA